MFLNELKDMKELQNFEDIQLLVDEFYTKVRKDERIGAIFHEIIQDNWATHLEKMYRFWETVLLEKHSYSGAPFAPHAHLPITAFHFERWIELFTATIKENFSGEKAEEAIWRANKMAQLFQSKLHYIQNNPNKTILK